MARMMSTIPRAGWHSMEREMAGMLVMEDHVANMKLAIGAAQ